MLDVVLWLMYSRSARSRTRFLRMRKGQRACGLCCKRALALAPQYCPVNFVSYPAGAFRRQQRRRRHDRRLACAQRRWRNAQGTHPHPIHILRTIQIRVGLERASGGSAAAPCGRRPNTRLEAGGYTPSASSFENASKRQRSWTRGSGRAQLRSYLQLIVNCIFRTAVRFYIIHVCVRP